MVVSGGRILTQIAGARAALVSPNGPSPHAWTIACYGHGLV
jgi:hypothetical protein